MRTRLLTLLAALALVTGLAQPASAGGSGDFYKSDYCRPFVSGPVGQVTNYDKGTGQELHYSTGSTVTWSAYRVYLSISGGSWIQLTPASEGYAYVSSKSATLTTKHVWRSYTGLTDSCTNVT